MMTSVIADPAEEAPDDPADEEPSDDQVVLIAERIVDLSTGDRAQLRRIYLTRRQSADGIVMGLLHHAGVELPSPVREENFAPWRMLAHVAAVLSGTGRRQSHSDKVSLGAMLYAADVSENRLMRLTASRGPLLYRHIMEAARKLAQEDKVPVNLWPFLHLAGNDEELAEAARMEIAQGYYKAFPRSKEDKK